MANKFKIKTSELKKIIEEEVKRFLDKKKIEESKEEPESKKEQKSS